MCHGCNNNYHFAPCSTLAEDTYNHMSRSNKLEWRCQNCKPRTRTVSASSTLVKKQNNIEVSDRTNPATNKEAQLRATEQAVGTPTKIVMMETNMIKMADDMKEIKKILQNMNDRMNNDNDSLKSQLAQTLEFMNKSMQELVTKIDDLTQENTKKSKQIVELEIRINKLEQQQLVNNIEIRNTTPKQNENLKERVIELSNTLNVEITQQDIYDVYRDRKNNIIVKITAKNKKTELLQRAKQQAAKMASNNNMFISDQLTPYTKRLLWLAKNATKQHGWKFAWIRDGKILARKEETSRAIQIRHEVDLIQIS